MLENTTPSDYPFEANFLSLDGLRYHYVDEGSGDVLLMIHGNPSWSYLYRNLVKYFSKNYRVIAPDHIGCGRSDKPSQRDYSYKLEQRVEDLERLIVEKDLSEITLFVHDWGGMIGLACAVRNPERFKRIVLFNTAAFPIPEDKKLPISISLCRSPVLGPTLVKGFNAFSRGAAHYCSEKPLDAETKKGFLEPYNSWQNRQAIYEFVKDIPLKEGDPSYPTLKKTADNLSLLEEKPCLFLWGRKDFVFDDSILREWQRRWPQAEYKVFENAGHYVIEDAFDEIVPAVEHFFKKHPLQPTDTRS